MPDAHALDFSDLVTGKHYGLVGMFKRADYVSAQLDTSAEDGQFTPISLVWHPPDGREKNNGR